MWMTDKMVWKYSVSRIGLSKIWLYPLSSDVPDVIKGSGASDVDAGNLKKLLFKKKSKVKLVGSLTLLSCSQNWVNQSLLQQCVLHITHAVSNLYLTMYLNFCDHTKNIVLWPIVKKAYASL